jgi:hypothetical protein
VFNVVPACVIQDHFRQAFALWGLPGGLRLDNGQPWGGWNDLPKPLALWLVGLGLGLLFNPVCRPEHNGVVEKSQGTGQRWAEPHTCRSVEELQERLDWLDGLQREKYPSLQGRSRLEVFPQLLDIQRPYSAAAESQLWRFARAQEYLAGHVAQRRASSQGQVWVYDHRYSVGAVNRNKTVLVQYDSLRGTWIFADEKGHLLREVPASEITPERILSLSVSQK